MLCGGLCTPTCGDALDAGRAAARAACPLSGQPRSAHSWRRAASRWASRGGWAWGRAGSRSGRPRGGRRRVICFARRQSGERRHTTGRRAWALGRAGCGAARRSLHTDGTPVCVFFSIGFLYGYTEDSIRSSALKPYRDVRFYTHRTEIRDAQHARHVGVATRNTSRDMGTSELGTLKAQHDSQTRDKTLLPSTSPHSGHAPHCALILRSMHTSKQRSARG